MSIAKTSVVIVGGGAAGTFIARSLSRSLDSSKHEVILINSLPYAVLRPPSIRLVVSDVDKLEEKILVPFDKLFYKDNGRFIQGQVAGIDEKNKVVLLKGGETVQFDLLVLATGQKWDGPIAIPQESENVHSFIEERRKQFKEAQTILLVGGGAVGIELAGEIRDIWADKQVTIIQRDRLLLNSAYPDKMRKSMQKQIESRGVKVILNDSVENSTPDGPCSRTITTAKGVSHHPDLIVHAWGPRPNTEFIGSSLGHKALTEKGYVKVKPTMQLVDHSDIFAAGDIVDWNEQKMIMKAQEHGKVITQNVVDHLAGRVMAATYKGAMEAIVVTNGKNGGMGYIPILWGPVLGSWLTSRMKSKDLFVPKLRGGVGY